MVAQAAVIAEGGRRDGSDRGHALEGEEEATRSLTPKRITNEQTYSFHHVELAVMEDATCAEWLFSQHL